ncbi:MAG: helix-turn-helix domain-containing protein, partial [Roseiflexaceae bacterium]|nr:helix-turn-helix domain-containing protein [Roseiflexaceae bacterium]
MNRTIQTTYRYRLHPTAAQTKLLYQFAGARRFVWNWALHRTQECFEQTGTRKLAQQLRLCSRWVQAIA